MMTKTKIKNIMKIFDLLVEKLGDDLAFSFCLDSGNIIFAVSTHKSTRQKFVDGSSMRTVVIKPSEFDRDTKDLLNEVVELIKPLLQKKDY